MTPDVPLCYGCLSREVAVKVDMHGFCHWFCALCWKGETEFADALKRLFSDVTERLDAERADFNQRHGLVTS